MAGTLITITDAGRAALVAPGNTGTNAHQVVKIGLASAPFVADKGMVAMPNERKRITTFAGANVAPDTVHVTLKDDTDDQFTLYGFGLYLENDVLLAVYSQPTPIMEKSPAAMLLLSADLQFTTIDATALTFGDATFLNPPATTERQGVIELATQDEVNAGTDTVRALTPKTAASRYAALTGALFTGPVRAPSVTVDGPAVMASASLKGTRQAVMSVENFDGLTLEAMDLGNTTKKPIALAPYGGKVLVGGLVDDGVGLVQVAGLITAQTPAAGDVSKRVATTEWVVAAIASDSIGRIVFEPRTSVRAGYLKLNGAVLNRADYPALWAYAQSVGAIVSEAAWTSNNWGCFSSGNGATTFRLPELRGEFIRCWDDARGADANRAIGTFQSFSNVSHAHGASAAAVGDHVHSAWTDSQGWHGHHGSTYASGDHSHRLGYPVPQSAGDTDRGGASSNFSIDNPVNPYTDGAGAHAHSFDTDGAGTHGHNVGIGGAGNHSHTITVNADGGNEARPRNVAMLAMIRAY
ncbi:phage tail protein [Paraburkholderia terricola]|uniref:phage tail protein n=1 Tax=Paraburkholderia terricola TaxID=169427 RepID=UPI000DEEC20C|nr:phage tail protein [Paraburkholderia terricola]AXE93971.1 phage tail protein [Paraburkholderia terricola]